MFDLFAVTMTILLAYIYYHGIIDHSGINFKAYWWQPWQPACIFHDNHHQYFHVNFGFNIEYWDKVRSDSHVYFMQTKSSCWRVSFGSCTEPTGRRIEFIERIFTTAKARRLRTRRTGSWTTTWPSASRRIRWRTRATQTNLNWKRRTSRRR